MRISRNAGLCGLVLLASITACHGDCYMIRSVTGSGRFGDTLVAVSGNGTEPGTAKLRVHEQSPSGKTSRYGEISLNVTGVIDTLSLIRLTLVSDPARVPIFSKSSGGFFTPDSTTFEKLFVRLATEDVLFEVVARNGTVRKTLLNLEQREGPKEFCEPWT